MVRRYFGLDYGKPAFTVSSGIATTNKSTEISVDVNGTASIAAATKNQSLVSAHIRAILNSLASEESWGAGAPLLAYGRPFVAAGDSITANGGTLSESLSNDIGRGYWQWVKQGANGRIVPIYQGNAGITGNRADELLARWNTDVIAKNPAIVMTLIGTNDILFGRTAAQILADMDAIQVLNRLAGIINIQGLILPRGSVGSPMTGPQIVVWEAVNAGLLARQAPDWLMWNVEALIGNMDAAHTIKVGYTTAADNLHPNTFCAQIIGVNGPLPILNALIANGDGLFLINNDPGNVLGNGFLTGTGGTLAGGATGTVATNFAGTAANMGGGTLDFSLVGPGSKGEFKQRHLIGGTYTGTGRASFCSRNFSTVIPNGSLVQIEGRIEVGAPLVNISSISLACTFNGGVASTESMAAYGGEVKGPTGPFTGVIRSAPLQLNIDVTSAQFFEKVTMLDSAGVQACGADVSFSELGLKIL